MNLRNNSLPELLSPAGSPEALTAAVAAGADAVYFGGASFSNRMRAKNFTGDEIRSAIHFCRSYGVKCYITVNTRVRDIELDQVLDFCSSLAQWGADALIVADMGIAAGVAEKIIPRYPSLELHASTQMSLATALDGEMLRNLGFTRMVVPRELHEKDLCRVCRESPLEIEMFIHGAHCVSYSGQCLMSWAMGGRSGNRGECAQPCRMMYSVSRNMTDGSTHSMVKSRYPLSLKDMCLASHIPEIIASGVASLKIEGRQKSGAYVYGVTSVYRKLLDERRRATREEIRYLDSLFSRDGFTDGYFTGNYAKMLGVRPENAESAPEISKYDLSGRRRALSAEFTLKSGFPAKFVLKSGDISVSSEGEVPEKAVGAAVTEESAAKNLTKFGGTPFVLDAKNILFHIEDGLYYPVAGLNAVRRACLDKLTAALVETAAIAGKKAETSAGVWPRPENFSPVMGERSCEVLAGDQVTAEAMAYFDRIYIPCDRYTCARYTCARYTEGGPLDGRAELCALLPAIVYDDRTTEKILGALAHGGCRRVMVNTLGQLKLAKEMGFTADGSFRLNLTNSEALETWYGLGLASAVISPELKLPAVRDLRYPCGVTVYGRIPLMITERCFVSDGGCSLKGKHSPCKAYISDRRGEVFPVFSDGSCRSVIYNSRKIWMADRLDEIRNMSTMHFMFTDETAAEVDAVIEGYKNKSGSCPYCNRYDKQAKRL